ncbi:MAG: glycoside hydrolase [Flavobacteriales bacterium 32-34-25]|nr:MAG: glycoside hydrolase [Flavobacteriales bacterium 32-34-25]
MIKIKTNFLVAALMFSAVSCSNPIFAQNKPAVQSNLPFEMPEVQIPIFKADTLNIVDFGAVPNTEELCTKAINAAITKCSEMGGGVVVIPAGLWTTGPLKMKSNVNLHTENGAFISFTSDLSQYKLIESYFEGNKVLRCESPIMGVGVENIAITGEGIFDGNGSAWRPVKIGKMTDGQWQELIQSGGFLSKDGKIWYPSEGSFIGNEEKDKLPKKPTAENMEPYKQALRPVMVSLVNCKKLLLDGVTFQNSPAWNVNPLLCEHLTLRNLTIRNPWYSQNGDGLDIESCRIGTVANCRFDVGDDAIWGGVKNIFAKNLTFNGTDCGLRFKSVRGRGGVVENIWMEDIRMNNIPTDAINFNLYYFEKAIKEDPQTGEVIVEKMPVSETTPAFRNMYFKNIYVNGAKQALKIMGIPEMPVENLQFTNLIIRSDIGIQMNYASKIDFKNIDLRLEKPGIAASLSNSQNVTVENFKATGENQLFWVGGAETKAISLQSNANKIAFDKVKLEESVKSQVKIIQ